MNGTPWSEFHRRWPQLKPPLRPNAEIVAAIEGQIAGHGERALLLGLTPEISALAADTTAVDWSEKMLAMVWPGDTERRRAIKANWLHLPCARGAFTAVIGDGSLNCLRYPSEYEHLLGQLAEVLRPGARFAVRMYLTPEPCESIAMVREGTMAGGDGGLDALKWRLANAICCERADPNISVRHILAVFDREFPDRDALAAATGWSKEDIERIDAYENLPDIFSFPTARQVIEVLPASFARPRFVPSGTYALAERCPLLVMDFHP